MDASRNYLEELLTKNNNFSGLLRLTIFRLLHGIETSLKRLDLSCLIVNLTVLGDQR